LRNSARKKTKQMTREEFFNYIATEQANYPELSELNSTSKVGVWYLIKWIFAEKFVTVQNYFNLHKTEVETIISNSAYATLGWYVDRAKEFQLDDNLIEQNGRFVYQTIDPTKQIIKQVALVSSNRYLIFKIAKQTTQLTACTPDEVTKFTAYINKIKYPGTFVYVESNNPDLLVLNLKIEYNALLNLADVQTIVNNTLTNYVKNISFNGRFNSTAAIDELQKLSEISNAFFLQSTGRTSGQSVPEAQPFTDYYQAAAGYMKIETLNIEYVPV